MMHANGVDFQNNKNPVTDEDGSYSTILFTKEIQNAISNDMDKKPFFIYGTYRSVHGPLEAPDKYLEMCSLHS